MATKTKESAGTSTAQKVLERKWGKNAIAAGFTALPNVIFLHAKELKLTNTDVLVVLHLASYWWAANSRPWPSKRKLATALDLDPRTIQRSIERMEKLGYVKRKYQKAAAGDNLPNIYNMDGLAEAADEIGRREVKLREKRQADDDARKATPRALRLVKGDKED